MADPTLTSISPTSAGITGGPVTMHCIGTGFTNACEILWGDVPLPGAVFVSATELTVQIDASSATFDPATCQAPVAVRLASVVTAPQTFTVLFGPPVLASLNPNSIDISTGANVDVVISGSNFWPHTQLLANGSPDACRFLTDTQLVTTVQTATATAAGTLQFQLKTGQQATVATLPLTLTGTPYVPVPPADEGKSPNTPAIPAEYMSPFPPDVYQRVADGAPSVDPSEGG